MTGRRRGRFVTFEGIEGVGKSTAMAVFCETLEANGQPVVRTREPGGTPTAERIRELLKQRSAEPIPPIAELLMMFAARSLNVRQVIAPALAAGKWVVCDRFTDATVAYQGGGRGIDRQRIDTLARWVHDDVRPDRTVLLDAPTEVGRSRAGARNAPDRFEAEQGEFFSRVRKSYLALAADEPARFIIIDADRPLEAVTADVRALAAGLLAGTDVHN